MLGGKLVGEEQLGGAMSQVGQCGAGARGRAHQGFKDNMRYDSLTPKQIVNSNSLKVKPSRSCNIVKTNHQRFNSDFGKEVALTQEDTSLDHSKMMRPRLTSCSSS